MLLALHVGNGHAEKKRDMLAQLRATSPEEKMVEARLSELSDDKMRQVMQRSRDLRGGARDVRRKCTQNVPLRTTSSVRVLDVNRTLLAW